MGGQGEAGAGGRNLIEEGVLGGNGTGDAEGEELDGVGEEGEAVKAEEGGEGEEELGVEAEGVLVGLGVGGGRVAEEGPDPEGEAGAQDEQPQPAQLQHQDRQGEAQRRREPQHLHQRLALSLLSALDEAADLEQGAGDLQPRPLRLPRLLGAPGQREEGPGEVDAPAYAQKRAQQLQTQSLDGLEDFLPSPQPADVE